MLNLYPSISTASLPCVAWKTQTGLLNTSSWLCRTYLLTSQICTVVLSGESKAGSTKNNCRRRFSNEEHFYSALTETAGKWRYKGRSDRVKEKKVRAEIWELPIISTLLHCLGCTHTHAGTRLCTEPSSVCTRTHTRATVLSNLPKSHEYDWPFFHCNAESASRGKEKLNRGKQS